MNPTHLIFSTIFKTIQDSVDSTKTKLLLFNKDWNTYKNNWQNATGIGGKIGSIITSSKANTSVLSNEQTRMLRTWNNAIKHGCTDQETFNTIIADADDKTKMYFASLNKGKGSIEGLRTACGNLSLSSQAAAIGMKALSIAGNMLAFWAVSEVITRTASAISDYVNSAKIARENTKALSSSLTESQNKYAEDSKKIEELSSRYETLSKGVNHLGQNISLSSSQYDEYKSIIQQLSDLMPNLTTRLNEQSEKIGFASGKLKDVNEKYKEYQKNQAQKFLNESDSEGKTYQDAINNLNNVLSDDAKWCESVPAIWRINPENSFSTKGKINYLNSVIKSVEDTFSMSDAKNQLAKSIDDMKLSQGWTKSAETNGNLTDSLHSLSNSWTEFVSHVADSGELKAGVDLLNSLVQGLSHLAEFITPDSRYCKECSILCRV